MADQLKQSGRVADFNTPLGKDVLVLIKIYGNEGLGELFQYNIEALSEQENIDFDKALGQGCTVKLKAYQGKERAFNGIMTQARWIGKLEDYHRYQLVLRPWLYLLGHKANCRIFLEKNVKDIIKEVFTKGGFNDFEFRTNEDYDKLHYTAQHRETDLAFVHRLMEQYGIYYFFEHSDSKHTLVLADSRSSHKPSPDLPKVPFIPLTKSESRGDQHLYEWISERHLRTGQVRFNDYDYVKPKKNLVAPSEASESYTNSKLQVYDFPGKYDEQDKGKKLSRVRLEAAQALDHRRHIRGDAASLYPGALVTVEKHPTSGENQEYLVVRSSPRFSSHHYRSVAALDEGAAPHEQERPDIVSDPDQDQVHYGSYEFQPSDHPFRMAQETPQPKIYGIQTALVVGKTGEEGEEISTDELGRICLPVEVVFVHFHPVQHVTGEVDLLDAGMVARSLAISRFPANNRPFQFCRGVLFKCRQGLLGKWGAPISSPSSVSPAMQRAYDGLRVATAFQHGGLAMAADVGKQFHSAFVAHQHLGVVHPFDHVIVAKVGHHQLMPDVFRPGIQQHALLDLQDFWIEIPAQRRLR